MTSPSGTGSTTTILVVVGLIACLLVSSCALVFDAASQAAQDAQADDLTQGVPRDWRPPIKQCPDSEELWHCIRHMTYRRDI